MTAKRYQADTLAFGTPVAVGVANAVGAATTPPRSDHVHQERAQPYCALTEGSDQSIPTGSATAITFSTETEDTSGMHSGSSSDITVPEDGLYHLDGSISWTSFTGNQMRLELLVNGTAVERTNDVATSPTFEPRMKVSRIIRLAASDVVRMTAFQNSGSSQLAANSSAPAKLTVARISK